MVREFPSIYEWMGKKASRNKERCQQQALLMITQADMNNKITNKKFLSLLRFDIELKVKEEFIVLSNPLV